MKEANGFWWPDKDTVCATLLTEEVNDLGRAIWHCKQRRTAIQAGGNVGVYPKWLASRFKTVYTAEPDLENFDLLYKNTPGIFNLVRLPFAFGAGNGLHGMVKYPENCGASHITRGHDIEMITIDSMRPEGVDFIQLDVEGFEQQVLMGAKRTIEKYRPVLMVEDRGHEKRYDGDPLIPWIEATYQYIIVEKLHHDRVLVPMERLE